LTSASHEHRRLAIPGKSISVLGEISVKNWRNYLVLTSGIVLVLLSFILYGGRVSRTTIPAGSTPQQIEELTRKYSLDRPLIEQYGWFLFTFLPGLTLLGIYGTMGLPRRKFSHWILVKLFIILMLITNTVTMLNFLITAQASLQDARPAFWVALVVAALALANFAFLLIIWNGHRWSVWAFGFASFILCTLKFAGQVPIFSVLFELSSVVILIYLLRSSWPEMN
jgi:ABC-type dipeptide/oligopeptide/nickel transport system permease component